MKNACGLHGIRLEDTPAAVDAAYAAEVGWGHGYRIGADSRLMLLGLHRLLGELPPLDKQRTAYLVGVQYGGMCNYETFDDSLVAGTPQPLSFAYALPSTPLAAASVRFGLRGPTITFTGDAGVGFTALRQALSLLERQRCTAAVAGCLYMPSATSARLRLSTRASLVLIVLQAGDSLAAQLPALQRLAPVAVRPDECAVSVLLQALTDQGIAIAFPRRDAAAGELP